MTYEIEVARRRCWSYDLKCFSVEVFRTEPRKSEEREKRERDWSEWRKRNRCSGKSGFLMAAMAIVFAGNFGVVDVAGK